MDWVPAQCIQISSKVGEISGGVTVAYHGPWVKVCFWGDPECWFDHIISCSKDFLRYNISHYCDFAKNVQLKVKLARSDELHTALILTYILPESGGKVSMK